MISRAQSGSRIGPRGRKPAITGLMSSTGVPSMASSPRTLRMSPSVASSRQAVTPSRLGRALPRWAKIPTLGQSVRPRGWRAPVSILVLRHAVEAVDHLDMGEVSERGRGVWRELCGVEMDFGLHRVPVIVDRLGASAAHMADRGERDGIGRAHELALHKVGGGFC